jgi:hypothetical protein
MIIADERANGFIDFNEGLAASRHPDQIAIRSEIVPAHEPDERREQDRVAMEAAPKNPRTKFFRGPSGCPAIPFRKCLIHAPQHGRRPSSQATAVGHDWEKLAHRDRDKK